MSSKLRYLKTPKASRGDSVSTELKFVLRKKHGENNFQLNSSSIPYLQGLLDSERFKEDEKNLKEIIEILEEGDTVDFYFEY